MRRRYYVFTGSYTDEHAGLAGKRFFRRSAESLAYRVGGYIECDEGRLLAFGYDTHNPKFHACRCSYGRHADAS